MARKWVVFGMSVGALAGFAVCYGYLILHLVSGDPPSIGPMLEYVSTGLCGLVGGITAIGLGQKAPAGAN